MARVFFEKRNVLEVETPLLGAHTVTEPNINSFGFMNGPNQRYLQTSPEYAMKRLLANGAPDIFQICKSFRDGESGRLHNPEFTLIEWYRLGFSLDQIMRDAVELICFLMSLDSDHHSIEFVEYDDAFIKYFEESMSSLSDEKIKNIAINNGLVKQKDVTVSQCIDFVFSQCVVPNFNQQALVVVYHYPANQAALAKLSSSNSNVSERFEIFYRGVELAHGYVELTDPDEQLLRFQEDINQREANGQKNIKIDERLIRAQQYGMPECAGVAVGFDRLMMLKMGARSISEVISFDWESA